MRDSDAGFVYANLADEMVSRQLVNSLDGIAENLLDRCIIYRLVEFVDDVVMATLDRVEQSGKGLGCLLG